MKRNIILVFTVILVVSCSENQIAKSKDSSGSIENKVKQTVLYSDSTNYTKFLHNSSPFVGYSSNKDNPLAEEELTIINDFAVNNQGVNTGTQKARSVANFEISVNGVNLSEINAISDSRQRVKSSKGILYGTDVQFMVKRNNSSNALMSKVIAQGDTTINMYIPNLVEITSPKIENTVELFPYCYYKDFVLKWNADTNNKNGLVVAVEWYGINVKGEKVGEFVRNIDVIPNDNGQATLNNQLFDNIPQNAIAYITLLRGNIEVIKNNIDSSELYRLGAETHAILPFIMIKNL